MQTHWHAIDIAFPGCNAHADTARSLSRRNEVAEKMAASKRIGNQPVRTMTILEGLSDLEQATIMRAYEASTGRPFRCYPCAEAGRPPSLRSESEADQPSAPVVAVIEEAGQAIPVCEDCYKRIADSSETR